MRRCWTSCCCGCPFQMILFLFTSVSFATRGPVIYGLPYMTKEPDSFECRTVGADGGEVWSTCTKERICEQDLPKDAYRPVDNGETFDNWVEKYDMLCEPAYKVGLIGSMYFVGVVISAITFPPIADSYGRKPMVLVANIVLITGLTGLLATNNLYAAYFFEALAGLSFGGLVIVGLTYLLEY